MATDPFEPRQDRRGSILDTRETSVAAPGFDPSLDPTIRRLFEQQAEIQAELAALLPARRMPNGRPELAMLRHKLRALETYMRSQSHDLYDARFLDVLGLTAHGEAPPGYTSWLDQNISHYDPVFRGWRTRGSVPLISRRQVSFKCWHDECIHQIYGFSTAEDRDEHIKWHANPLKRSQRQSTSGIMPPAFSLSTQPREFSADRPKQGSPTPLPRLLLASSSLPGSATMNQPGDRRGSLPGYPPTHEFPPHHRNSLQVEPEVDPMLPPLKRSRVGHSRLESIGELRLPRETGPCLRCKVQAKPCDLRDDCAFCLEAIRSADDETWAVLGCHRGPLANLADYMLPEALSPRQTHTPITSPMARRRNMNDYLERTYVVNQNMVDLVKYHLDFNDGFWWTEDLATLPMPNPTLAAYSKEPKDYPPPVLKVLAASWNAEGVPFQFWELFRLTSFMSESRESEAVQYPVLYRAKLLLREILFYDLQQPEPSIRTEVNVSNAQLLPDDMNIDSRNRLIYNCMAQFLQSFESITMRRALSEPRSWLAIFISLCIFSIVRTILADLISTPSRNIAARGQNGLPINEGATPMHSVYKALVHVFAWSTPMLLDTPMLEMDENDRTLFAAARSAIRKEDWLAWGIRSTKDFLLGLGSGYLVDNIGFNGFVRQRTPIYRKVSYTQPAVVGEAGEARRSISVLQAIDPWANRSDPEGIPTAFGMQQERRHTVAETPALARAMVRGLSSPTKLRTSYQRPPSRRVYCSKCNEMPDGFRGEHELRRHTDSKHAAQVKRHWFPYRNAKHASPKRNMVLITMLQLTCGARISTPTGAARRVAIGPPCPILKDWMREVRQSIDINENNTSSEGEDEHEVRMMEEYTLPRQPSFLEAPRLAPAPPQGPILAPSMPPSLESTVHSSPSISKAEDNRNRCPHPDCGRVFKDLAAHMLTHQEERPEKCPIETCEYHTKGFARKYDKNRHALTHYKGTMVCPFCPGPGTSYEKAFNRADVFKRHLTAVHNVEQTPPNSRKMIISGSSSRNGGDAKCSICQTRFSTAQEFYEHLDDCVLNVIVPTTPKASRDQTSTPQKGEQDPKNARTNMGEGDEKSESLVSGGGREMRRSAEASSTAGSAEVPRETTEKMDLDSDRGD
ncbi:hypothetical protein NPX13_g1231 [Xylaria arbuscula]|uniref:C2H2-type domain-containing protein n=1 Tax=Xylaria arbuscula TaxID=114810 RepID=A0A9W8TQD2_9PEZI|nr:hypothetical protein NPX13_g1231 [Xylaria arbuscula]